MADDEKDARLRELDELEELDQHEHGDVDDAPHVEHAAAPAAHNDRSEAELAAAHRALLGRRGAGPDASAPLDDDELELGDDDDDELELEPEEQSRATRASAQRVPKSLDDDGRTGTRGPVFVGVAAAVLFVIGLAVVGPSIHFPHASAATADADPSAGSPASPPATHDLVGASPLPSFTPAPIGTGTEPVGTTLGTPADPPGSAPGSSAGSVNAAPPPGTTTPGVSTDREIAQKRLGSTRMALEAGKQIAATSTAGEAAAIAAALNAATHGEGASTPADVTAPTASVASVLPTAVPTATPTPRASTLFVSASPRSESHEAFVASAAAPERGGAADPNGVGYSAPGSATEITAGTVLDAVLYPHVDSDLPGTLSAMITRPVYDSRTHSVLVIPVGAWLDGKYDTRVSQGENRLLVVFTRIRFPDGSKFTMGSQQAVAGDGTSGLGASVDTHQVALYRGAFLLGLVGAAAQLLAPPAAALTVPSVSSQVSSSVGSQLAETSTAQVNRGLQQPPTLTTSHALPFKVLVARDLPLVEYHP